MKQGVIKNKDHITASHVNGNPKVFWKYVQNKLTRKSGIPDLHISDNNIVITKTDKKKADVISE